MWVKRQLFGQASDDFRMQVTPASWCGWIGIAAFQVMIVKLSYLMAWKLLVNLPYSLEISLMETDSFSSDSWQRSNIIFFSAVVNLIVIVTELIINPKYSISQDGTKTNFSGWTTKPRLPKRVCHCWYFKRISSVCGLKSSRKFLQTSHWW